MPRLLSTLLTVPRRIRAIAQTVRFKSFGKKKPEFQEGAGYVQWHDGMKDFKRGPLKDTATRKRAEDVAEEVGRALDMKGPFMIM